MVSRVVWVLLAAAFGAWLGCSDDEIGTPLTIELIGPETGLVGDSLSVQYDISGRSLDGVIFFWGDGALDSVATVGAQTASGSRSHVYLAPGVFTVQARVEDAVEGVGTEEVTIDVQGN